MKISRDKKPHYRQSYKMGLVHGLIPAIIAVAIVTTGCSSKEEKIQKLINRLNVSPSSTKEFIGESQVQFDLKDALKAAASLKEMGNAAVPYLVSALKTNSPYFKHTVGWGEYLSYSSSTCQFLSRTSEVLGEIKRGAPDDAETAEVVNALIDSIKRCEPSQRDYFVHDVRQAIVQIGGAAVAPLITLLDDRDLGWFAVASLGEIGAAAKSALPKLQSMRQAASAKGLSNEVRQAVAQLRASMPTGTNTHSIKDVMVCLDAECASEQEKSGGERWAAYLPNQPPVVAAAQLHDLFSSLGYRIDVRKTDYRFCNLSRNQWAKLPRQGPDWFPILWEANPSPTGERLVIMHKIRSAFRPELLSEEALQKELARMEAAIRAGTGQTDFSLTQ